MPDPKLKAAMEEIKGVLKKHDICGSVILASASHMEYLREVEASWTALKVVTENGEPVGIRFRCRRQDYASQTQWSEALRLSIGTLMGFMDALESDLAAYRSILSAVSNKMLIEHMTKEEELPTLGSFRGIITLSKSAEETLEDERHGQWE